MNKRMRGPSPCPSFQSAPHLLFGDGSLALDSPPHPASILSVLFPPSLRLRAGSGGLSIVVVVSLGSCVPILPELSEGWLLQAGPGHVHIGCPVLANKKKCS